MEQQTLKKRKQQQQEEITPNPMMPLDDHQPSSSLLTDSIHETAVIPSNTPYHTSACGSILHSIPTNNCQTIFSYLLHGNFEAFRQSIDVFHRDIIKMRNEQEQTVLHVLTILSYPYKWVRLMMMRGCDLTNQDRDGYTAAHYAVERDDVEMLKALTVRFLCRVKPFSNDYIDQIYQQGLKSLTLRNRQGLTVFMLACFHQSIKCLDYLLDLKINDVHLQDQFGDTCLHYAVARRNEILVEKLITQCHADVNAGSCVRPSAFDILEFDREHQSFTDRSKEEKIQRLLIEHQAQTRCSLRRTYAKRKSSIDDAVIPVVPNVTFSSGENQIENARNYARLAVASENLGQIDDAEKNYQRARDSLRTDCVDRAIYADRIANIRIGQGDFQSASELIKEALNIRLKFEQNTDEIDKLERSLHSIEKRLSLSMNH